MITVYGLIVNAMYIYIYTHDIIYKSVVVVAAVVVVVPRLVCCSPRNLTPKHSPHGATYMKQQHIKHMAVGQNSGVVNH